MSKTVYIETSIPSFFYEERAGADMVARRDWTRQWWAAATEHYDLVTSPAVIDELERGDYPSRDDCLKLVDRLELLEITPEVLDVVDTYIARHVMPADPAGDALHLAVASVHHCDFLVTWNCRHLANANKFGHIRRVNSLLGLYVPTLVTPLELLEDEDDAT